MYKIRLACTRKNEFSYKTKIIDKKNIDDIVNNLNLHTYQYVEKGNLGGKGSDTHSAVVVGDTVGDPFKDTSGPSMNILINVMAMVSLVISSLLPLNGIFF